MSTNGIPLCLSAVLVLTLPACMESPSFMEDWYRLDLAGITPERQRQKQRADDVFEAVVAGLDESIDEALAEGSTITAIPACREGWQALAAAVQAEHGVTVGRTTVSPLSRSEPRPTWVAEAMEHRPTTPVFYAGPGDALAGLFPKQMRSRCLQCHTSADRMQSDVRAALGRTYTLEERAPYSRTRSFAWFWVEVPGRE